MTRSSGGAQLEGAERRAGQQGAGQHPRHQHLQLRGVRRAESRGQHHLGAGQRAVCGVRADQRRVRRTRTRPARRPEGRSGRADQAGLLPRVPGPAGPRGRARAASHPGGRRHQGRRQERRHQGQRHRQVDLRWHPGRERADLHHRQGAGSGVSARAARPDRERLVVDHDDHDDRRLRRPAEQPNAEVVPGAEAPAG